jgi:anti-anti-sigma regulatory factor
MTAIDSSAARLAPAPRSVPFLVRRMGERLAVIDAGEWLDESRARRFSRAVLQTTDDGVRELVLDLSRVRHHAWPAVYALCELEARLSEACCEPVAAAANSVLVQDLRAVGLDRAWSLSPTLPDALADLLGRTPA